MPRSLADGHEKVSLLTTMPAAWLTTGLPTAAELNSGIDISLNVLASDWSFGASDSEQFTERAVGEPQNAQAYGVSNGSFGMTLFRYYLTTGAVDATADAAFAATKLKGSTVYVFSRRNGKLAPTPWAMPDEIRYGAEVLLDSPQDPGQGGYIKQRIPGSIQRAINSVALTA